MNPEICAVLRCSRRAGITYRGKPICGDHWEKHCRAKAGFSLKDIVAYKPEYRKVKQ
jgi:hypothetical protein